MALPRILKGFTCYIDALSTDGELTEMTRPKMARKYEEYRAGGWDGSVQIDMGLENLECELKFGGYMTSIIERLGVGLSDTLLRIQGSLHQENSLNYDELRIEMRGRFAEVDPGSDKAGDLGETSSKYYPTYYKESLNGKALIEIDIVRGIFATNGVDRLASKRKALGL